MNRDRVIDELRRELRQLRSRQDAHEAQDRSEFRVKAAEHRSVKRNLDDLDRWLKPCGDGTQLDEVVRHWPHNKRIPRR